ncbi:MAG TPA: polysaccharide deacetylase family protein [Candidatus Dormibacteraeota bacterium]|nr:polysaccharide deacetylase family protein [Candidatus Dormibacteraeota bacterium]
MRTLVGAKGIDLKLIAVVATLGRAGTTAMCALMVGLVIVASYTLLVSSNAHPRTDVLGSGLYLANDGSPRFAPVTSGFIPLGRTEISVPILMYHYIQNLPKNPSELTYNLTVTPDNFSAQMDWLRAHAYHPVTIDDLRDYFTGRHTLPSKPVVITLDDGYRDLYTTAYPILRAHAFKAVAYIVTGFVNEPRYVTSDMIAEMDRYGVEIASHTVDHANLARMTTPSVTYEAVYSKQWLEKLLGHPIVDFAYPSGKFDATDERVLQDAGYSTAVTELESPYHTWATRLAWSRTRVPGSWRLADFIKGLGPIEPYVVQTTLPVSDS